MADTPRRLPQDEGYTCCPHCTIQIPVNLPVCPHCQQVVSPPEKPRRRALRSAETPAPDSLWERYGKWIKAAVPILLAVLVLLFVYQRWVGQKVSVVRNPSLPIEVEKEKRGDVLVIRGTVTNRGDDVPDLSLRSIGVIVEFAYRDGRRERKTVFPRAEFRGEGALLHGEKGTFELEGPAKDIREIVLRSEILDLGMGQKLIPPRGR